MAAQQQICDNYGPNLDLLPAGTVLGLLVDSGSRLHLYVDGRDQGVAAGGIPQPCYVLIDLYGQCQQVTVVSDGDEVGAARARGDVEKADVVDGMKEPCWAPPPEAPPPPCPYQALCARFKELLLLPDAFFSPDPPRGRCFCERCHQRRGGDEGGGRGGGRDPPAPLGWCRYGLRPRPRAEPGALWAKWPRAFLGTDAGSVRRALDRGEPVPGPASVLCRPTNEEVGGTAPPPGPPRLVLSPALPYAALEPFATKVHFRDPGSQQALGARVAFEVLLRPGSFRPGPPSLRPPAGLAPPPGLDPAHLEWVTREPGAAVLCGLLVRVE